MYRAGYIEMNKNNRRYARQSIDVYSADPLGK
jgi:hypothetical protein